VYVIFSSKISVTLGKHIALYFNLSRPCHDLSKCMNVNEQQKILMCKPHPF
jgi:hypothetical protein